MSTHKLNQKEEQVIENAVLIAGRELGIFLNELDIPPTVKSAIIAILPNLSLEDIQSLRDSLKLAYEEQAMVESDEGYMKESAHNDQETIKELDEIISELDN